MRGWRLAAGLLLVVAFGLGAVGEAAEPEQFFASVFLDDKKIGQFHVRINRAETGEIEELRARASVSILGVKLYEFTHDLTQTWRAGELQKLRGMADDNGTQVRPAAHARSTRVLGRGQQEAGDLRIGPAETPSVAGGCRRRHPLTSRLL